MAHTPIPRESPDLEDQLRSLHQDRNWTQVATLALRQYGPELVRFACAMMRSVDLGQDVFAEACERIWVGIPTFRFDCSFRTWSFVVVRRLCIQNLRHPRSQAFRPLSEAGPLSEIQAQVRTQTLPFLRDDAKDRLRSLRESLTPEEQAILSLRLDRQLSWSEIGQIMDDSESCPTRLDRQRREAVLRKQFERLKDRLREMAKKEGLLEP